MAAKKKSVKPVAKKSAPKKAVAKPVKPIKKASPPKGVTKKASSKPVIKKAVAKKAPTKPIAKKGVAKKIIAKPRKPIPAKKTAKPINKSKPVKKSATPVVKKAAPKKLATPVKNIKSSVKQPVKPVAKASKAIAKVSKAVASKSKTKHTISKLPVAKPLPKAKDIKVAAPKHVVIPKITTTKSRKYEPEFTKSVLDKAPQSNNGPTHRYSDGELNEFRELIQRKLETAKKELGYLQGLITRKDEMGGDDTDNRYMTMEDGSLSMEREQLSQMASRQITFIDHLEKAMMRIENKTYGICRVTGKLIDKARLRAVPHATLSIEAKMGQVR